MKKHLGVYIERRIIQNSDYTPVIVVYILLL